MIAIGLMTAWLLAAPAPSARPAVDARVPVVLHPIRGLPADSVAFSSFASAFATTFHEARFTIRRPARAGGAGVLTNGFRLVRRNSYGPEWKLGVVVSGAWDPAGALPADNHPSRGTPMVVEVVTEAGGVVGEPNDSTRVVVTLATPAEPRARFFASAGRVAARLAVEALHHRTGDLDMDATLRLEGAQRAIEGVPQPPRP